MNSVQIGKFMESVKIGYIIQVSPSLDGSTNRYIVKDMYDGGASLIPENDPWDSEPFEVDLATSITSYRILVKSEKEAPFSAELKEIAAEIEETREIEKINFELLREMMPERERDDCSRRVEAIWSATNTAHDKNKFDDIIRRCNKAIQDFGEEKVFLVLRGYNAYRYSLLDVKAPKWEQAKSDFKKAKFARGIYWLSDENSGEKKANLLLDVLLSEKKIDKAVLYSFIQNATDIQAGTYLHSLLGEKRENVCETVEYACIYVAKRAKGSSFRFPDDQDMFSAKNMEYILEAIPTGELLKDVSFEEVIIDPIEIIETVTVSSEPEVHNEVYTGWLVWVDCKRKFGYVRLDKKCNFLESGDLFYHLSNIIDDQLCYQLENEIAQSNETEGKIIFPDNKYRIEFYVCKNTRNDGSICAGDIRAESLAKARDDESTQPVLEYKRGYITSFTNYSYTNNREVKKGWIDVYDADNRNKRYGFKLTDVADPYVREYLVAYWDSFAGQQDILVSFAAEENNARQICRVEAKLPRELDQDIERTLSHDEKSKWKVPRQQEDVAQQLLEEVKQQYGSRTMEYRQLPRWEGELPKTTRPPIVILPPNDLPVNEDEKDDTEPSTRVQYYEYFRRLMHRQPYSNNGLELLQSIKEKQGAEAITDQYRDDCIRLMNDEDSQQVVTPIVGYLFDYYIKLNNYNAAIGLLDAVSEELDSENIINRRVWFSRDKYLNRRVTALEKAKANGETEYLDELYLLYKQKQSMSALVNQKYHFQYKRANIRYSQGRYVEAIRDYEECLSMIDDVNSINGQQRNLYECRFYILIADCYLAIQAVEKSKEFAKRVQQAIYRNVPGIEEIKEQANSIMQGNRLQNAEEAAVLSELPVVKEKNKQMDMDSNNESDEYPPYINYLLSGFALADVFRGKDLIRIAQNNSFLTNANSRNMLLNYLQRGLDSWQDNANSQNAELAMAKFIVGYSMNKSNMIPVDRKIQAFQTLGSSLRWYADEYIRTEKKESAIYLYTLAAQYLHEREYTDCLYRATGSVFKDDCNTAKGGLYNTLKDDSMEYLQRFCAFVKGLEDKKQKYTVCLNRFIGLFEVARFDSLLINSERQRERMGYIKNVSSKIRTRALADKIVEFGSAFLRMCSLNLNDHDNVFTDTTDEEFMKRYEDSVKDWDALRRDFERMLLTPTGSAKFLCEDMRLFRELITNIQKHEYYLIHSEGRTVDAQCIEDMLTIASSWYTYHNQRTFSERITALNQIVDLCEGLKKKVLEAPTSVSFELVLPNVEAIMSSVHKEMDELYQVEPMLKLDVVDDNAGVGGCQQIRFDLILLNAEAERQNVTVSSMKVDGCEPDVDIETTTIFQPVALGGGKQVSYEMAAKVSESIYQQGFFKTKVTVTYSYQVSHDAQIQSTKTKELDAVINLKQVQFTEIENPYVAASLNDVTEIVRTGLFEKLQKTITRANHTGTVLWGQKRSGKTVIVKGVKKKCQEWNTDSVRYIYANVDMMASGSADPYKAVLKNILQELSRSIKGKGDYYGYPELSDVGQKLEIASKAMKNAESPRDQFLEELTALGDRLEAITRGKDYRYHIIIAIDEFTNCLDMLDKGILRSDDLVFWKKLVESSVPLHLILVAHDNWRDLLGKNINALAVFDDIQVSYMTEPEADELITRHMKVSVDGKEESRFRNDCHKRIMQLTSRSPYLIQEICSNLIEFMNDEKMVYIVREQLERFIANRITGESGISSIGYEFFDPQLNPDVNDSNDISHNNKALLQAFAKASNNPETDWISLRSVSLRSMSDEIVNKLLDALDQNHREIIERKRDGDGDQLIRFNMPLLGVWLKYN